MRFNNHFDYPEFADAGEVNNMPDMTIPDQSIPLKELISRYVRGVPVSGREPMFYGEDDGDMPPDLDRMELTDRMELLESNRERIRSLQANLAAPEPKPVKQLELELPAESGSKGPAGDAVAK